MISICITVKNRSRVNVGERELSLFPNCVRSIVESTQRLKEVELVVADWESNDWPLSEWLSAAVGDIPLRVVVVKGPFSRGRGRNVAAAAARGDPLLFLDADSLLCEAVLTRGLEHLQAGRSYFPVVFSFKEPEHQNGWWRHFGYGNCMVTRKTFELSGGWPDYSGWGGEDDDFFERVAAVTKVVREEVPGFYHQWHPEDVEWKDQFVEKPVLSELEKQQLAEAEARKFQLMKAELQQTIPTGETFILVDEDQWALEMTEGRRAIPFLEKDGQYWGAPEDDETAIREFERLRQSGAHFLVFGWPAFWWLKFYAGLYRHLFDNFKPILRNERLIIFALQPPEDGN